jgi:hypothetical protein
MATGSIDRREEASPSRNGGGKNEEGTVLPPSIDAWELGDRKGRPYIWSDDKLARFVAEAAIGVDLAFAQVADHVPVQTGLVYAA